MFYNNFNNKCPTTVMFGVVSSQTMRHQMDGFISHHTSSVHGLTLGKC